MGGSGGAFIYSKPDELKRQIRREEEKSSDAKFQTELSGFLNQLLTSVNDRDVSLVQSRLSDLIGSIEDSIEGSINQLFGGSVSKHTYVDGLSDIDSLVILNDTNISNESPSTILNIFAEKIRSITGDKLKISHGKLAITVEYDDGMKIQLLPAIRSKSGLRIPSTIQDVWSKINPEKFQKILSKRNDECGLKLVPTIKLAKAVIGTLPESLRLSGYHVESLAINAFKNYEGEKTTSGMLPVLFKESSKMVLSPMRDRTGQSLHVDDYLGEINSDVRKGFSHILGRISKRMLNANAGKSIGLWRDIFGVDE